MKIYKYSNGVELFVQQEPINLFFIKKEDEFITSKLISHRDFRTSKNSFSLEIEEDGELIACYNHPKEEMEVLFNRLERLEKIPATAQSLFSMFERIEKELPFNESLYYHWNSYNQESKNSFKAEWLSILLENVDLTNPQEVKKELPVIIKNSISRYVSEERYDDIFKDYEKSNLIKVWEIIITDFYEEEFKTKNSYSIEKEKIEDDFKMVKFENGIELYHQNSPLKMLFLKNEEGFKTEEILSQLDFIENDETAFYLKDGYYGKDAILINYSEETLQSIILELSKIEKTSPNMLNFLKIIEVIEKDFTGRRGLRQEWESKFSSSDQSAIKMRWAIELEKEIKNIKEEYEKIPHIILRELKKISNMNNQWECIDEEIQEEIIETWGLEIKDNVKNLTK